MTRRRDGRRAVERRSAAHCDGKLREAGFEIPAHRGPGMRTRLLSAAARRVSLDAVLPIVEQAERGDAVTYGVGHLLGATVS